MDLHVLPICGANVVIGVQWLKTLGPILTDYNALSMQFFHEGHLVEFQGDTDLAPDLHTPPQLRRLIRKQGVSAYFHISITPTVFPSNQIPSHQLPLEVQHLFHKFSALFHEPHSLPPSRPTDHHIHLNPHSKPVNVRPY